MTSRIRLPKARAVGFTLLIFFGLSFTGCRSCESRDEFLAQVKDNLANDVRPSYEEALNSTDLPEDIKANRLALLDDTISSIDRILTAGEEGASE